MSVEEAQELGRRAIYHATFRDSFSGGVVNCKMVDILFEYVILLSLSLSCSVPYQRRWLGQSITN